MILLKNGKLDMAWWLLFSEPVGIHLCDIATAGIMKKKKYVSVCARVCIQTHTLQFTYTHTAQCKSMKTSCFDPTANWGYIHECGNTYTFL